MRKFIVFSLLAGSLAVSSCAYRTCPTYATQEIPAAIKQEAPTETSANAQP